MTKAVAATAEAIRAATATTQDKLTSIEDSLALVRLKEACSDDEVEDRASAIQQLEYTVPLAETEKLLHKLLPMADEGSICKAVQTPNQSVSVSFGANNKGMQVGVSNAPISSISFGRK